MQLRKNSNLSNKFINAFSKLAVNKQLSSLRDGFAFITPLMIIGAVGVVFLVFIFGGWGSNNASLLGLIARAHASSVGWTSQIFDPKTGEVTMTIYESVGVQIDAHGILSFLPDSNYAKVSSIGVTVFGPLWDATVGGSIAIYSAFIIGYFYSRQKNSNQPIIAGLVSLASFFIVTGFNKGLFGPNGSLVAIITAFVTIEIYSILEKSEKLKINMPAGVPPAVANSFSKLFPLMITSVIIVCINVPFVILNQLLSVGPTNLGDAIYTALQAPFTTLATDPNGQLGIGLLFITLVGFFWFFGLHGSNILDGAVNPIWYVLLAINIQFIQDNSGEFPQQAMAKGFWDAYVYVGGTGGTLALLAGTLLFSKRKDTKELSKFAIPAGLFQINEPVTFGYPMLLNTTFFVPFVFTMPILTIISWLAISVLHWVPGGIVAIPWSTPMILGAFLHTGSWQGPILALCNFIIAFFIYLPFILIYNKQAKKENMELDKSAFEKMLQFGSRKKEEAKIKEADHNAYEKIIGLEKQISEEKVSLKKSAKSMAKEFEVKFKQEQKAIEAKYEAQIKEINNKIAYGYDMTFDEYKQYLVKADELTKKYQEILNAKEAEFKKLEKPSKEQKQTFKKECKEINKQFNDELDILKGGKIIDALNIDSYNGQIAALRMQCETEIENFKKEQLKSIDTFKLEKQAKISSLNTEIETTRKGVTLKDGK